MYLTIILHVIEVTILVLSLCRILTLRHSIFQNMKSPFKPTTSRWVFTLKANIRKSHWFLSSHGWAQLGMKKKWTETSIISGPGLEKFYHLVVKVNHILCGSTKICCVTLPDVHQGLTLSWIHWMLLVHQISFQSSNFFQLMDTMSTDVKKNFFEPWGYMITKNQCSLARTYSKQITRRIATLLSNDIKKTWGIFEVESEKHAKQWSDLRVKLTQCKFYSSGQTKTTLAKYFV